MCKWWKRVAVLLMVAVLGYMGLVVHDKLQLEDRVLRLHVVADSDSASDQAVKLEVRDAVLDKLRQTVDQAEDKDAVLSLLEGMLDELQTAANEVLDREGVTDRAVVTLDREAFPERVYDTFKLPSGVYDSLRVTIGSGEGRNWWCVVFPSLCTATVTEDVEEVAAGAGFSEGLSGAITGEQEYQIRFFLLDWLGRVENFFFRG